MYGREYTADELVKMVLKDRDFWGTEGGVTFSGGEALMQTEALEDVFRELKNRGVHLAVETALFVPEGLLEKAMSYIDDCEDSGVIPVPGSSGRKSGALSS